MQRADHAFTFSGGQAWRHSRRSSHIVVLVETGHIRSGMPIAQRRKSILPRSKPCKQKQWQLVLMSRLLQMHHAYSLSSRLTQKSRCFQLWSWPASQYISRENRSTRSYSAIRSPRRVRNSEQQVVSRCGQTGGLQEEMQDRACWLFFEPVMLRSWTSSCTSPCISNPYLVPIPPTNCYTPARPIMPMSLLSWMQRLPHHV